MKAKNIRILDEIFLGIEAGVYDARNPLQKLIFQYLWIPLVQWILDAYQEEYNGFRQRFNKNSTLPTGVAPNFSYSTPAHHAAEECLIPVHVDEVARLKLVYPGDLFEYMEPGIKDIIEGAFAALEIDINGVTLETSWSTFSAVWEYLRPEEGG